MTDLAIRLATVADVPTILQFIRALAEYEKLLHLVVADEDAIRRSLFGPRPAAEVLLAERDRPIGFALFFQSYSTFLAKPGLYLEDLFVLPDERGHGAGLALMKALACVCVERDYGRFEWAVLDWNAPSIAFYKRLGAVELSDWNVMRLVGAPLEALASLR
ncbi:MAG TPA: GNAT family N-acetyltransferase [Kofleriaceae bacterium]|jgi:GNAT superfamily N-acetyltransferase|nr:GNAT family N-acetyltransferase [Kofleriaceae bacterium]